MIRTVLALITALTAGISVLAQAQSVPAISHTFPPAQDIRMPDRTISNAESGPVSIIAYNVNGRFLATAGNDKIIHLWESKPGETGTGELLQTFEGHAGRILAVAPGIDTNSLVSVSVDQTVKTWDLTTGKLLRSVRLPVQQGEGVRKAGAGILQCAKFRPGKERDLAECTSNQVRLWNYESGAVIKTFAPQDANVSCLAFRPDGKVLAAATDKGRIRFWDVDGGTVMRTLETGSAVKALAVSAIYVAAGCADGSVKLWQIDGLDRFRNLRGQKGVINALAFSGKGEQLAGAGADKTVKVWDVETGKLLCSQEGHAGGIVSVAFSPNGQKMASGGVNGSVRYWTVPLPPIPPDDLEKITAALPEKATATPQKPRRILVFWRSDAILHKRGVPAANHAIELLGKKTGAFQADFSRDYEVFDPKVLANYDAIVMNSSAHLAMPDAAKKAYLDYVKGGGGVVGIHAAMDTFRDWPEGAKVIGATFGNHPWGPSGTWAVKLEEPDHPLLRAWGGRNFKIRDELYEMGEPFTRADRRSLLSVDLSDPATAGVKGLRRPDRDFVLSWIKRYGEGRVFYCVFGHNGEPFQDPAVLRYYLDGIQYAIGDLHVDDSPKTENRP